MLEIPRALWFLSTRAARSLLARGSPIPEQGRPDDDDQGARVGGRGVTPLRVASALALALHAIPAASRAATPCALPAALGLAVEQRGPMEAQGPGLVASAPAPPGSPLHGGDAVRQANGMRVERCADLERAAAEARAKGLALLLGIERDGAFTAVAAAAWPQLAALPPPAPAGIAAAGAPAVPAHPTEAARAAVPTAIVTAPPPARSETTLPPSAQASSALRRAAADAAQALATIDDRARLSVPLVLYERRLADAATTIAALGFESDQPAHAVRQVVQEILDYHRTARDVWQTKLETLEQRGVDRRAANASSLPYFSDSKVPAWVATYPFLQASLLEAPRETRLLLPAEKAGRWDPDRALELLWDRARGATARLAAWAREG